MSRTVWKLDFPLLDTANGTMRQLPAGAKFLACAVQYGDNTITAWFEVDPDGELQQVPFQVFGTGQPIADSVGLEYLGTTLHRQGSLVLHLYGCSEVPA